ncbi:hypothetical protein SNSL317_A4790 [Salmonella enterica subsp. enterica serovar Newport str. SL317]|nr:hypothetical protein SNSL317_A4790 [Salmonella enterica subsp. enterica serovar Newport str. SL317]CDF55933.1 hypothetical protein BN855_37520 [Salmonella enterica subsp. enterica serovar Bovismorbificans str. 3114]
MPEWRVNLSPKSENVITGDLSNCLSKWITITLQMAGRKWGSGGGIDVLCYKFLSG